MLRPLFKSLATPLGFGGELYLLFFTYFAIDLYTCTFQNYITPLFLDLV